MSLLTVFKRWGVKRKLVTSYVFIVLIPISVLGIISYQKARESLYHEITSKLQKDVGQYQNMIEKNILFAKQDVKDGKLLAKQLVRNQANAFLDSLNSRDRNLPVERLKKDIANMKIGKSGYAFVLDYKGNYVVSKDRKRDGVNIYDAKDRNGTYFVREIISKGKVLRGDDIGFHVYPWKVEGEDRVRDKIAAIIHLPKYKWVVGLSAYFNDLVNDDLELQIVERFKNQLKAEKVGKTGYMYVMDSSGKLIFHPTSEGKNISKHDFIKEMMAKKHGIIEYPWDGRMKLTVYTYYKDMDWIIASGSYLSDFIQPIIDIRNLIITVLAVSVVIALCVAFFLSGGIVNPILRIIDGVNDASAQVAAASRELSDASQELSNISNEQAASLEETSSSLEEITGMAQANAENADQCSELTVAVNTSSEEGNQSMQKLTESMQDILESNNRIMELVKVIDEIGDKTKVIDEIVFQTKLLSFNASVEAERAGEHGRGFAVVAQEVGNLAQMSGKAATEISAIVNGSIKNAEEITSENKAKVVAGNNIVNDSAKILEDISTSASEVLRSVSGISNASKDQTKGIEQINMAMSQLSKATQENASTAEEAASSSVELNSQADTLNELVTSLTELISGANGDQKSYSRTITKNVPEPSKTTASSAEEEEFTF